MRYAYWAAPAGAPTGRLMIETLNQYGYLGIFLALLLAGFGFPIPEELPVITAGVLVGHAETDLKWYIMLPVVIAGVVIGDAVLYTIGRLWGHKFLDIGWVQRHFVPPGKRAEIEKNFADRGIMILLGARLLPGIRAPIFIIAGTLRVPLGRFLLADALYAIPLVNVLFWSSYLLTDRMLELFYQLNEYKPLIMSHLLAGVVGALVYKYVFARHVSTGDPPHVPQIIAKPAGAIGHAIESAVESVTGRHHGEKEAGDRKPEPGPEKPEGGTPAEGTPAPSRSTL